MARKKTQRVIPLEQLLARAEEFNAPALEALKHYQEIREAGGIPEVRYSEFAGYDVVDKRTAPPL